MKEILNMGIKQKQENMFIELRNGMIEFDVLFTHIIGKLRNGMEKFDDIDGKILDRALDELYISLNGDFNLDFPTHETYPDFINYYPRFQRATMLASMIYAHKALDNPKQKEVLKNNLIKAMNNALINLKK